MSAPRIDQSCCLRIQNSNTCANIKGTTLTIWTAITTIVLIGSILAFLAMKGYDLAILNKIPSYLSEVAIYSVLAASGLLTIMNLFLVAVTLRHYLNKQYSQKEVAQSGLYREIMDKHNPTLLFDTQYTAFPYTMNPTTKEMAYVVVTRNGYYAFREEDSQALCIQSLGFTDGTHNQEYPIPYFMTQMGINEEEFYNAASIEQQKVQINEEYLEAIIINNTNDFRAYALITKTGLPRFFKTVEARAQVIQTEYSHLKSSKDITQIIQNATQTINIRDDECVINKIMIENQFLFFAKVGDKVLYNNSVPALCVKITELFPNVHMSDRWVNLFVKIPASALKKDGEKSRVDAETKGFPELPTIYGFNFSESGNINFRFYLTAKQRDMAFFANSGVDMQALNAFSETYRQEFLVDHALINGDIWFVPVALNPNGTYRIASSQVETQFFLSFNKLNDAVTVDWSVAQPQGNNIAEQVVQPGGFYSEPLATYLVSKAMSPEELQSVEMSTFEKEYADWQEPWQTQIPQYKEIFPVFVRDGNALEKRVFKTDKEKKQFVENIKTHHGFTNSGGREYVLMQFCLYAADPVSKYYNTKDTVLYWQFQNGGTSYVVSVRNREAEIYYNRDKIEGGQNLNALWVEEGKAGSISLSEDEKKFLNELLQPIRTACETQFPKNEKRFAHGIGVGPFDSIYWVVARNEKGEEFIAFYKNNDAYKKACDQVENQYKYLPVKLV